MFELQLSSILSDLSIQQWIIILGSGMLIGMSKAGVPGVSMVVIPLMAMLFGGKQSTGIILPMLIIADVFGVSYYHRHAEWKHVLRALPWAVLGVLIALIIGNYIDDTTFKQLIAIVIFVSLVLLVFKDRKKQSASTPDSWWFAALMGLGGGFATMIGNAAGPIFAIYLLAIRLPKNSFIGTAAWFFFIINLFKFPLHVFVWKTISWETLSLNAIAIPAIAIGAFLGFWIVKHIPNHTYRWIVIVITFLSALLMFF